MAKKDTRKHRSTEELIAETQKRLDSLKLKERCEKNPALKGLKDAKRVLDRALSSSDDQHLTKVFTQALKPIEDEFKRQGI